MKFNELDEAADERGEGTGTANETAETDTNPKSTKKRKSTADGSTNEPKRDVTVEEAKSTDDMTSASEEKSGEGTGAANETAETDTKPKSTKKRKSAADGSTDEPKRDVTVEEAKSTDDMTSASEEKSGEGTGAANETAETDTKPKSTKKRKSAADGSTNAPKRDVTAEEAKPTGDMTSASETEASETESTSLSAAENATENEGTSFSEEALVASNAESASLSLAENVVESEGTSVSEEALVASNTESASLSLAENVVESEGTSVSEEALVNSDAENASILETDNTEEPDSYPLIFDVPTENEAQEATEEEANSEDDLQEEAHGTRQEEEDDEPEQEPYDPEKPRRIDGRFDFVELFVFTLAIVMLISSFLFRHSIVEGPSMEGTLYEGEHLIISDVFYTPRRGDIIVCEDHTTAIKKPIVKRIIAIGGDYVEITRDGRVLVNDVELTEDYVNVDDPKYRYTPLERFRVPDGELFVMGDHRNESTDSRDPNVGTVSEDSVLGRVILRFYPFSRFGTVK